MISYLRALVLFSKNIWKTFFEIYLKFPVRKKVKQIDKTGPLAWEKVETKKKIQVCNLLHKTQKHKQK